MGKATVPRMPLTIREAGILEKDFSCETNASFKLGVKFCNWNHDAQVKPIDYMNSFAHGQALEDMDAAKYFRQFCNGDRDFTQSVTPQDDLARLCKGARELGAPCIR